MKETAADPEVFKDSFAEWEAMAEHELSFVRSGLGEPVKVFVRADELLPWCLTHGKPNDAAARVDFAVQKSLEG